MEKEDTTEKVSTVRKSEKRPTKKKAKSKNSLLLGNETGSKRKNTSTKITKTASHGFYTEADDHELKEISREKMKEVGESLKRGRHIKKKAKLSSEKDPLSTLVTHEAMNDLKGKTEIDEEEIIQTNLKLSTKSKRKLKMTKSQLAKYLEDSMETNHEKLTSMPKETSPGSEHDSMWKKLMNAGSSSDMSIENKMVEKLSILGATEMAVIDSKIRKGLYKDMAKQVKEESDVVVSGRSFMNKYPWEYDNYKPSTTSTTAEEEEDWNFQEVLYELSTREEFSAWNKSTVPEEVGIFANYVLGIPGIERLTSIRKEILSRQPEQTDITTIKSPSHAITVQELLLDTGIFGDTSSEKEIREMILKKLGKWTYLVATTVLAETAREEIFRTFLENSKFGEVEWMLCEDLGRPVDLEYVRRFLREAVGDERQCCRGEQCISLQLPKMKDFPTTKEEVDVSLETIVEEVSLRYPSAVIATPAMFSVRGRNEGFVMREYLTPSQLELWREKSLLPRRPGCCFMCLTSLQTFYTYKAQELKVDPPFQCYFYRVKIEEGKGFSKSQLLHSESGQVNTLQFDKNDYKLGKTRITVGSDHIEVKCWDFQIRDF